MKNLLYIFFCIPSLLFAQLGPLGNTQSIGVSKESKQITSWATNAVIVRGSQHIGTDSLPTAVGTVKSAIGKADGNIVSLGDGGYAIVTFNKPIKNNIGNDFAVFENAFANNGGYFLELAFVEVSSDGINFVRFPAISKTKTQISTFGNINPDSVYNLAGKHIAGYGTPFDLEELKDSIIVDINNITHIKIIDVIGDSIYSSKDSQGNIIYDPFPTPFTSGGFDLDAVAIIDETIVGIKNLIVSDLSIQNPVSNSLEMNFEEQSTLRVFNLQGKLVLNAIFNKGNQNIDLSNLPSGLYVFSVTDSENSFVQKVIKQ